MSMFDEMAAVLHLAVSASVSFGTTWTARARTSAPGEEPRTYSTPASLDGHRTPIQEATVYDDRTATWSREQRCRFRTSDAATRYRQGDQFCETDGATVWAVMGVASTGVGTIAYDLMRSVPLVSDVGGRAGGGE